MRIEEIISILKGTAEMSIFKCVLVIAAILMISVKVNAEEMSTVLFQPGERWCAVGDSITHGYWGDSLTDGGRYIYFVNLYYQTRFPDRRIDLFNCGIGADTAPGAVRREKWDILVHKPTVVSIMLGMNDMFFPDYAPEKNTPQDEEARQASYEKYCENMRKLVGDLQAEGVRVILITPSIFDDTAELGSPPFDGAGAGLQKFARFVMELAEENHCALVDFNGPMTRINRQQQETDPKFTIVGSDRVHPETVGHFVMAYQFLKAQGAPVYVSRMGVDASDGKVIREANCEISDIRRGEGVSFTCLEHALPFPVSEKAKPALDLVPFIDNLNREELSVSGLKPGRYSLSIDGIRIGEYDSSDLENGINLAVETSTPQYKQALSVMKLNHELLNVTATNIRRFAMVEHIFYGRESVAPVTLAEAKPKLDELISEWKGEGWSGYVKDYMKDKPREAEFYSRADKLAQEMRRAAQPIEHKYVLKPIER